MVRQENRVPCKQALRLELFCRAGPGCTVIERAVPRFRALPLRLAGASAQVLKLESAGMTAER
jgi:hypothetical protein